MKRLLFLFVFFLSLVSYSFGGEPVPGAEIIIEQCPCEDPVAMQVTGNSGTITFDHLDQGDYVVFAKFPRLKGKWLKGISKLKAERQPIFNADKKELLLNEPEGVFAIHFNSLKKVSMENFNILSAENKNRGKAGKAIGGFRVDGKIGKITIVVEAVTPKEFSSKIKKVKHDTAKATINNVR